MENKILYNQTDVNREIRNLFKAPTVRRVAISAFVGRGAESYLPNPQGLMLVCWPKAGGTNPNALRKLMEKKVEVFFSDRLHMKVYWAANRGCVITSANLSRNALGAGNLKEAGILIGPDEIDIDELLKSTKKRAVNSREMKKLDRAHTRFVALNKVQEKHSIPNFIRWFGTPNRPAWKLGWFDTYCNPSNAAKEKAMEEFEVREPHDFITAQRNDYKPYEWVLTFNLSKESPTDIKWLLAERIVNVSPRDKQYEKDYPCEAFQALPPALCPGERPFRTDSLFCYAFRRAVKRYGADRIKQASSVEPTGELIDLIATELRGA